MSDGTKIEWTNATWNPVTGCTPVSEGCRNCYAAELAVGRLQHHPSRAGLARRNAEGVAKFTGEVRFNEGWLDQPLRWTKPRMIFVVAHGDLFHEDVPDAWIDRVFAVMALCPQHVFQVLTKRPERMRNYLIKLLGSTEAPRGIFCQPWNALLNRAERLWMQANPDYLVAIKPKLLAALYVREYPLPRGPLPNVWLGVSVEDQATAHVRIPLLLDTPAAKRWISAEPLLGPVTLPRVDFHCDLCGGTGLLARWPKGKCHHCSGKGHIPAISTDPKFGTPSTPMRSIDWVVVGGENSRLARPMHPDWVRDLRDQCAAAGVPFFFKQWGAWSPHTAEVENAAGEIETTPKGGVNWYSWDGGVSGSFRVGKKAAGHLLDGVEHREFPA